MEIKSCFIVVWSAYDDDWRPNKIFTSLAEAEAYIAPLEKKVEELELHEKLNGCNNGYDGRYVWIKEFSIEETHDLYHHLLYDDLL